MKLLNDMKKLVVIFICIIAAYAIGGNDQKTELPIISSSQGWGLLGIDTAVIPAAGKTPRAITISDKTYTKGLGTHAPSSIVLELLGNYDKFSASAGVQSGNAAGTVVFQLFADGEKIFDSGVIKAKDGVVPVNVSVKDVYELELVVTDAGDGRNSDVANWANVELVPLSDAKFGKWYEREMFDIAPFAKVYSWDPAKTSQHPNRVQELSVEQIFMGSELAPAADGSYDVPAGSNGERSIGLQWYENKNFRGFMIEFADDSFIPDPANSRVEWWAGKSAWQGDWLKLSSGFEVSGNKWFIPVKREDVDVFLKKIENIWHILPGTVKVRFVFPASQKGVTLKTMQAFTTSMFKNTRLLFECEQGSGEADLEIYDGQIINVDGSTTLKQKWDISKPLQFTVQYSTKKRLPKSDRTIINLRTSGGNFSVAADDIVDNGAVYVPCFNFFATLADKPVTLAEYKSREISGKKTILEQVREMPDQSFVRAMEKTHRKIQNNGPTMLSLAADNTKFIVRESGLILAPITDHRHQYTGKSFHITPTFGGGKSSYSSRYLEDKWMPILVQNYDDGDVQYIQKSYAAPSSKRRESVISWLEREPILVCEFTIKNTSAKPVKANISLAYNATAEQTAALKKIGEGFKCDVNGKMQSFTDINEMTLDTAIDGNKLTVNGMLPARSQQRFVVYITGWNASDEELSKLPTPEGLLAATKKYWTGIMASSCLLYTSPSPRD